jgi:hypothetical protein
MALFTTCKLCMASVSSREVVSCANLSTSPSDVPSLLLKCSGAFVAAPVESFGGRRSCRLENGALIYYRPNLESMFESSRSRMVVKKTTTAKLIRASSAEVVNGNSSCEGYLPKAEFYKVEAILRFSAVVEFVRSALTYISTTVGEARVHRHTEINQGLCLWHVF